MHGCSAVCRRQMSMLGVFLKTSLYLTFWNRVSHGTSSQQAAGLLLSSSLQGQDYSIYASPELLCVCVCWGAEVVLMLLWRVLCQLSSLWSLGLADLNHSPVPSRHCAPHCFSARSVCIVDFVFFGLSLLPGSLHAPWAVVDRCVFGGMTCLCDMKKAHLERCIWSMEKCVRIACSALVNLNKLLYSESP